MLFNGGNEQRFSLKSLKKFGADPSCRFLEKRKKRTFNFDK